MVGTGTADSGRGLVVTERDHHEVRVVQPGDPLGQRRHRVLDGLPVQRLDRACVAPGDAGRHALRGHRIEYRAVPHLVPRHHPRLRRPRGVRRDEIDLGHHGVVTGLKLEPLERRERELVGHRRIAEHRSVVADVAPVVQLVVVVERGARDPRFVVGRDVADRAPARLLERIAQRVAVAGHQLVVALLVVHPETGLQRRVREPADAAERGGREERTARLRSRPLRQRGRAAAQHGVDGGRERGALHGDLAVALHERDDHVLAAQTGEQLRGRDAGVWVGRMDRVLELLLVTHARLGVVHLRGGEARRAGRGERLAGADLNRQGRGDHGDQTQDGDTARRIPPMAGGCAW